MLLGMGDTAQAARPNILLIIADDYGADGSSLFNSTNGGAILPPTPNIASLVTNGVVFRSAYANPLCSPTRACLLTGRHGFRTGIGDVVGGSQAPLSSTEFTLPRAFSANGGLGYQLAHFGKWHLANGPTTPLAVGGWTNYVGNLIGQLTNYYNWAKTSNGVMRTSTNYATTDLVNDATAWISARGTNSWFLWTAFNAPHTPFHLPPTNLCPHYAGLSGTAGDIIAHRLDYYHAMIEAMDTEIGRLLAALPDRANTHIIFLGDNGTLGSVIQPPLTSTRGKETLYEGGIHVPFIISGPAVTKPNRTNDTLVNPVDVFPTILEMAGSSVSAVVPATVTIDGQSLMAALQTTNVLYRRSYSELFGDAIATNVGGQALRDERYKLIRFTSGEQRFYDLQSDPVELTNLLAATLTATQQQYRDRLTFWLYGYSTNTGPRITSQAWSNGQFSLSITQAASYALWRCDDLGTTFWSPVTNAVVLTNGATVTLKDVSPPSKGAFYKAVR